MTCDLLEIEIFLLTRSYAGLLEDWMAIIKSDLGNNILSANQFLASNVKPGSIFLARIR